MEDIGTLVYTKEAEEKERMAMTEENKANPDNVSRAITEKFFPFCPA